MKAFPVGPHSTAIGDLGRAGRLYLKTFIYCAYEKPDTLAAIWNIAFHINENWTKKKKLLHFLLIREKPEWLHFISIIKVIAKCGCGKCPTVLFCTSLQDQITTDQRLLIDYLGTGKNGEPIGVSLFGNNKVPTELEFWSIDGQTDVIEIPSLETLQLMPSMWQHIRGNKVFPLTSWV